MYRVSLKQKNKNRNSKTLIGQTWILNKYIFLILKIFSHYNVFFLTPFDDIDLACMGPPFLDAAILACTIVLTLIFLSLSSWKFRDNPSKTYTVRNFCRNFPKHVTRVLFSYSFVKLRWNFRKFSYFLVNLRSNFLIFSYKLLNILILISGNSETCNRNNLTFWVTEVLCSYM